MNRFYPFLVVLSLLAQSVVAQPIISSFTPTSGPIGTTVTITGTNFGVTPGDNIVYFGPVKAVVSAASGTSLTVTVPVGTAYHPITVTTAGLTAAARLPFTVTFPGSFPQFSTASFADKIDIPGFSPRNICLSDFDGDGKPDIAILGATSTDYKVLIYKNSSVAGKILLATPVSFPKHAITLAPGLIATDLDGDGLSEIVTTNGNSGMIEIYHNTSTAGTISFANPISLPMSSYGVNVIASDLDGDGKPELISGCVIGVGISIYRNFSTPGNINLGSRTDIRNIPAPTPMNLAVGDLDGDGKPDLALADCMGVNDKTPDNPGTFLITVLRNTSTTGAISFDTKYALPGISGNTAAFGIAMGDLDGDGKPDLAVSDSIAHTVSVYKNISQIGDIEIATGIVYPAERGQVSIADFDGDNKPDLAISSGISSDMFGFISGGTGITLLKNQSSPGTLSFAGKVDYTTGIICLASCIGDIDGDGKPDIVTANTYDNNISILRNKIGEPLISPSGANPVSGDVVKTVSVDASVQQANGITYVQRHYDIEPVNNSATATAVVQLYFTQADFDNFNAFPGHGADLPTGPTDNAGKANLRIYQNHGFSTTNTPGSYNGGTVVIDPDDGNITWNAGTQLWEVTFAVTGFSGFFVSTLATSLPLKLLSFTATAQSNNALLKWSTTNEFNTSYFELQRSTDGSAFAPIAKLNASGNSSTNLSYQYTDALGADPVYYFRLKMVDIDGASSLSDIVKITVTGRRSPLGVYPNPARNYITVEHPAAGEAQIQLADMSGKVLQQVKVPKNSLQSRLNIEGLAPGTYQIIWSDGTKTLVQSLLIL